MKSIAALCGLFSLATAFALPLAAEGVTSQLTVSQVVLEADGSEVLEPADTVSPGETLQYALVYSNETDEALNAFTVVGPVPEGTDFIAGSASASPEAILEAQVSGIGWSPVPVMQEVVQADGTIRTVEVPASAYEALRWRVAGSVAPGLTVEATYRVRVED